MRPSSSSSLVVSLLVLFLLLSTGAPSLGDAAVPVHQQQGAAGDDGHGGSAAADSDAFCRKVATFAVFVYSLWNDINPVPKLEKVLSASTRPAEGSASAMEYHLVLRVAGLGTFRALVWGVPTQGSEDWKLKYFEPVDGA
ncbi:hypothetical protein BDA96_01G271700 [Sorghum bicolor]|jgi:hypothetical protein|uniref:Cysteine proteinase inhibitor n=2 Tax=Sorghum bicolor TaxID=4558 RepID=A0A921S133_SORBI|nr:hypothetical protein BDA96_01G271700 [Sorghum bicolor]OQU91841.1 hypothetical protein SORBI_3001G256000 [Sorghum bicolor]